MITAFYAAILALIYLFLSAFVIQGRFAKRVSLGAGDDDNMAKRIRAHGNFAEYVPFALILLMFAEMQNAPLWSVQTIGILLVLGRILHVFGIINPRVPNIQRILGMVFTMIAILLPALWCLWVFTAR